jgi:hypothetical protein
VKPWRQGDRYEEEWLGVELELESLEVVLAVGDLDHNVLEAVLVSGDRWESSSLLKELDSASVVEA